ncbi:MAG: hypothetical protein IKC11_03130 [Clostridia bacterium]|nr:hypothetical protein [Clostridia bacterium]
MYEKIKRFFRAIGVFFVGLFFGIFGGFLYNRKRTRATREQQSEIDRTSGEIEQSVANIESGIADAQNTTSELTDIAKSNESILRSVRERKQNN